MRRTFLKLAAAAFAFSTFSGAAHAKCGEVSITEMNWASSAIVTAVSKFLMEQGYGCKVKTVPSSTIPSVTSVAETGKPDIITEIWLNSVPKYLELEKEGKIITAAKVLSDGGVEGWWIPEYLAKEHPELTKIENVLKNPKLVGGRFHNCPVGWGCRVANDNLKVAYGLEDSGLEVFNHGSGETLATSIGAAYADKKPWFGYYWGPTAVLGKYKMVKVDVGPYKEDVHSCNQKKDCSNPGKSDFPTATVLTGVTSDFAKREPEIFELMKNVSFTNAQMNDVLAWQQANKASNEEAAVYFLNTYKSVWGAWLSDEAKGKLASLLK